MLLHCKGAINLKRWVFYCLFLVDRLYRTLTEYLLQQQPPAEGTGANKFCFEVIMPELINPNRKCAIVVI